MENKDKLKGAKFGLFIKIFFINSFNRHKNKDDLKEKNKDKKSGI